MSIQTFLSRVATLVKNTLSPVDTRQGWSPYIREPNTGAWQRNMEISVDTVMANHAVYSCSTLIANDIAKLRPRLMEKVGGIWVETENSAYSPVLRKPNRYQNYIQFKQWWIMSKLSRGNTYALKQRDSRGVVTDLYILDPLRCTPLVASNGDIYYQLGQDILSGVGDVSATVPASEIIHDRMNCLFHPLVGISPLFASALTAGQGIQMQTDSSRFFQNGARPGGILSGPGEISDDTAKRLKDHWDSEFSGINSGKVAVLGDDLKFQPMRMTSSDAQLIEQMKWSAEVVCSTFHVPPFKVQMGTIPSGMKVGDMNLLYYSDCLQSLIEEYELCMDEGLGLGTKYETNLDLEGLLRMDLVSQAEIITKLTGGAVLAPNEGRRRMNLPDVKGGDSIYLQQQQYSLEALAKRDAAGPPANTLSSATPPAPAPAPAPAPVEPSAEDQVRELFAALTKGLNHHA